MELIFYSRCCIMGSGVDILARKIRSVMTVVESWIAHYKLDPMVWLSNFHCLDEVFLVRETFFILKCACLGASLNALFLLEIAFFSNLQYAKLQKFLPIRVNHSGPVINCHIIFQVESRFESSCGHLNFRFCACFEQGVPWHSGNYRVWIHSEMRTWHDGNMRPNAPYRLVLTTEQGHMASWSK